MDLKLAVPSSLGSLELVEFEAESFLDIVDDEWFCCKVVVTTPEADVLLFPCNCWLSSQEMKVIREATGQCTKAHRPLISHKVHIYQEIKLICITTTLFSHEILMLSFNKLSIAKLIFQDTRSKSLEDREMQLKRCQKEFRCESKCNRMSEIFSHYFNIAYCHFRY